MPVTGFSPNPARPGQQLVITGAGLDTATGVSFAGAGTVPVTLASARRVQVMVPAGAQSGPFEVVLASGPISGGNLAVVAAPANRAKANLNAAKSASKSIIGGAISGAAGADFSTEGDAGFGASASQISGGLAAPLNVGLNAALSPLGASGQALSQLGGAALGTLQRGVGAAAGLAGGVLGAGAGFVGGAISGVAGLAGGLIGGVGSAVGGLTSALPIAGSIVGGLASGILGSIGSIVSGAGSLISGFISTAVSAVTGVFKSLGEVAGEFGKIAGEALQAVISIVSDVFGEVRRLSGEARTLSATAGISRGSAYGLLNGLEPYGISAGQIGQLYSGPFSQFTNGLRFGAAGLGDPTRNSGQFLQNFAERLQSVQGNPFGTAMLRAQVGEQAFNTFAPAATLGPQSIRRINQFNQRYGVDAATTDKLGGQLAEASSIISIFATRIKVLFADALLPIINTVLPRAIAFLEANKDKITEAIQRVATFIIDNGVPAILKFGSAVLWVGSKILGGVSILLDGLSKNWPQFLQGVDSFLNGLRSAVSVMVSIGSGIVQFFSNLLQQPFIQKLLNWAGFNAGTATTTGTTNVGVNTGSGGPAPTTGSGATDAQNLGLGDAPGWVQWLTNQGAGEIRLAAHYAARYVNEFTPYGLILPAAKWVGNTIVNYAGLRPVVDAATGASSAVSNAMSGTGGASNTNGAGSATSVNAQGQPIGPNGQPLPWSTLLPQQGRGVVDAYSQSQAAFLSNVGVSDLAGKYGKDQNLINNIANYGKGAQSGADTLADWSKSLADGAEGWGKIVGGKIDTTNQLIKEQTSAIKGISGAMRAFGNDVVAKAVTQFAEDQVAADFSGQGGYDSGS